MVRLFVSLVESAVARPLILRITISGAFLALTCENQPDGFGTG